MPNVANWLRPIRRRDIAFGEPARRSKESLRSLLAEHTGGSAAGGGRNRSRSAQGQAHTSDHAPLVIDLDAAGHPSVQVGAPAERLRSWDEAVTKPALRSTSPLAFSSCVSGV